MFVDFAPQELFALLNALHEALMIGHIEFISSK